jgi:hypothetical protein
MRGVFGDCLLAGRSYALGGGGSGDLVTDRSSFTTPNGLSRNDTNEDPAMIAVAPIAIGRQETIAEQSPGVDGTGQPGLGGASLSRSAGSWRAIPAISCISALVGILESHA